MAEANDGKGNDKQQSPRDVNKPPGIPDELLNMVGASPPRFVNFEQLMSAADGMNNLFIAHEIAVNNDFELAKEEVETDEPPNNLVKQVRKTMHKAFWDVFDERLNQDPPDFSMAVSMIEDIREILLSLLLPQHDRLKVQVKEVLDLDLIKQQMENEAFSFEYYGTYVTDTMAKLCAPARDQRIAEIREIKEISAKFRAIIETLEWMQRDMANFTIKQIRPYIQQHSIEYEKKKFEEYFQVQREHGENPLSYTEVWIDRNYKKLVASQEKNGEAGVSNSVPTPSNIMTQAYLEVFEWPDPINFPETLLMDQFRYMGMRDQLHMLGLITSVQLITYSVIGNQVQDVEELKLAMKEHVQLLLGDVANRGIRSVLESISMQVVKDVDQSLVSRKLPPLTEDAKKALKGQITAMATKDNKIRKLMNTRLMSFIREGCSSKNILNIQVPKGCSAVHKELSQILGNFLRLTSHNRSVFGEQYSQIIEKLTKPPGNPPTESLVNGH